MLATSICLNSGDLAWFDNLLTKSRPRGRNCRGGRSGAKWALIILVFIFILLDAFSGGAGAQGGELVSLSNDYVRVFVNNTDDATCRFALDTTGGDPTKSEDDNKPLIYGRPVPWTSFTTIRIDGKDYCYGGATKKRAGEKGLYGDMISRPHIVDGKEIVSICRLGDSKDIEAIQSLRIVRSSTTGLFDTAEIRYVVTNEGTSPREIGVRILLDTMLGANDGAPFRVRGDAITSDTAYTVSDIPEFWQAFDSLSAPSVTSQGTLSGQGATPPDRVYLSNWGSLADGVWDFDFSPGREFIRKGEYEPDSAIALFWDPKPLAPGESREYVTLYGLGGISISPGDLSLGVSSPAEVAVGKDQPKTFPVVCYVENSGKGDTIGTRVSITLPEGLSLKSGQSPVRDLGTLKVGELSQVVWDVVPKGRPGETLSYSVRVEAENAEPNQVTREVRILGAPKFQVTLSGPRELSVVDQRLSPDPFKIYATIKNVGGSTAYGVQARMSWGALLSPAPHEKASRFLGPLDPQQSYKVVWQLEPRDSGSSAECGVKVEAHNAEGVFMDYRIAVPRLEPRIEVMSPENPVKAGSFFPVYIRITNVKNFLKGTLDIAYDPDILQVISVSRGTVFVEGDKLSEWRGGTISEVPGQVHAIGGRLSAPADVFGTFACINFLARTVGKATITINNARILNADGREVPVRVINGVVMVSK